MITRHLIVPRLGETVLREPAWHKLVQGRIIAVATQANIDGNVAIWVEESPWPRHALVVRTVRDNESYNTWEWTYAGSANLHADAQPIHVLWQRRLREDQPGGPS